MPIRRACEHHVPAHSILAHAYHSHATCRRRRHLLVAVRLIVLVVVAVVVSDLVRHDGRVVELSRGARHLGHDLGVAPLAVLGPQLLPVEFWILEDLALRVGEFEHVLQQRAAQLLRAALLLGEELELVDDALHLFDGVLVALVRRHLRAPV